jgi:DNA ligase-associated metallophosphoesterase
MQAPLKHELAGKTCWLSPGRCLFVEQQRTLVVSDLHFGKTGHFRKAGIGIPQQVYQEDLQRLMEQVMYFKPETILFTGDLFHSDENLEHELFARWRKAITQARLVLVKGNHDRLADSMYTSIDIEPVTGYTVQDGFGFIHDKTEGVPEGDIYWFSGHVHPGIRISGLGRQSLCFPCFHFMPNHAILPAFSRFTGLKMVDPGKKDQVFAIIPGEGGRHAVIKCP